MRLKRVQIFGFKTFADRAEFTLDGGIVAVIGPNGCGKSNLVDAILWGLGEGSARQLRAQSSADVIFNGSSSRKPVGFSQVTLLFDNEDGALPIDGLEVAVTRKVNRAGESEYFINRRPCRLKDLHDLLADSGLGRAGYAIVGQKDIDQALAASPEERRAWIDEAAGVRRYRSRKIEAQRRLNSARLHLDRVQDILAELEAQREPLRDEAETARRYKSILNSLQEVEMGLLAQEIVRASDEISSLEARLAEASTLAAKEAALSSALEASAKELERRILAMEGEAERLRRAEQEEAGRQSTAESEIRLAEERLRSLDELEKTLGLSADEGRSRIAQSKTDLDHLSLERESERQALERLRLECGGAGEEAKRLAGELGAIEARLTEARATHAEQLKKEAEARHSAERLKDIRRELKGIDETLPELEDGVRESQTLAEAAAAKVAEARSGMQSAEAELQAIRTEDEKATAELRKRLAERSSLEGRYRGIEGTIDAYEALNQGARAVLEGRDRKALSGEFTAVGEAIDVPKELALAIETALGGAANDLIVETETDAKAAIAWLKEHRLGRATFQPLTLVRSQGASASLRGAGVVGRASDLVDCDPKYRPVIESLLGRVVVVETLDDALRHAKSQGWSRLVTLDGEVVHHSGAVTGGRQAKQGYGLVQRKVDLHELRLQMNELDAQIRDAESKAAAREAGKLNASERQLRAREAIAEIQVEADEARSYWQALAEELAATVKSRQRLEAERTRLTAARPSPVDQVDMAAIEAERDVVLRALAARSVDAESAEARLREGELRAAQAAARYEAGVRRLRAAEEDELNRAKRLEHIGPDRDKLARQIARDVAAAEHAAGRRREVGLTLSALIAERSAAQKELGELREQARQARDHAAALAEGSHEAEIARARAESRRAAASQRLLEEYAITEEEALARSQGVTIPPDASAIVSRLRRELRAMGDVNVGAIEAFERLSSRFDELEGQKTDILQGIEQIEAGITELDKLTRDRFLETFERLQTAFAELLTRLFPGGEGRIWLTEPDRVIDTGIDIEVTLPGKRRQRLELLSGGERALCAVAFLFSLLKVKPSPLVILDEVDAPLDGRNVERYVEMLEDFSRSMQFIVITHNPTTIEAAPIWLGVTMQEPGVSTLARVRAPIPNLGPGRGPDRPPAGVA